jgi:hypothetical protein
MDFIPAGGFEPKSRVKVRVTENDDERKAGLLKLLVSYFDQFTADALALVFRQHGHGSQSRSGGMGTDNNRAVHDMPDYAVTYRCDQGEQNGIIRPECIHDVALLVLPESAPIHLTNCRDVARTFFTNLEKHVLTTSRLLAAAILIDRCHDIKNRGRYTDKDQKQ